MCVSNHCDISIAGELDANRPVPFRLTPSIQHFLSPIGVAGPLHMNMVAIARCLVQVHHSLPSIIQAILRDQFIAWQKVSMGNEVCYHAHRPSMIWGQRLSEVLLLWMCVCWHHVRLCTHVTDSIDRQHVLEVLSH